MGIVKQFVLTEIRGLFNNIEVLFKAESKVSGKLLVPVVGGCHLAVGGGVGLGAHCTLNGGGTAHKTGTEGVAVTLDAPFFQNLDAGRGNDRPVDHNGSCKTFLSGNTDDLVVDHIVIPGKNLFTFLNVKAVRKFTGSMKRQFHPVRVVNKLLFPDVRNLTHITIKVVVVIETVQCDLQSRALVDLFQPFEIKVVKGAFGTLLCKIGPEKAVVVNVKVDALEGFFIVHHNNGLTEIAVGTDLLCSDRVELLRQSDIRHKTASVTAGRLTIQGHRTGKIGDSLNKNCQSVGIFFAVIVVQHGTLSDICDLKHG